MWCNVFVGGGGGGDGGVTRHCFHLAHRCAMRATAQPLFHAAMLITQRDFQMQHFLPGALETEVTWFNDSGMNRADRNLVDFPTVYSKKITVRGRVSIR